ncbi:hypothetical protein Hanom_Chr09g00854441 [Helianthus anomalus]
MRLSDWIFFVAVFRLLNMNASGAIRVTSCQTTWSNGVISKSWRLWMLFRSVFAMMVL